MSILQPFRLNCWWEHKLSPILATIYATALLLRIPLSTLWPVAVLALAALFVCASYVSILNDLTDAEDDRASGKLIRTGEARIYSAWLLAACMAAGAGFLIVWRHDTLLLSTYLLCWLAFTLYSAPPFRLKVRGIWGVLADASGAHLFPTLFAVVLVYHWNRTEPMGKWIILVATWSFAAGVRGILWHQLGDVIHDAKIGLRTFVCLYGPKTAERLGLLAFFFELTAFAAMLWFAGNALAAFFLGFYGLFALLRWLFLGVGIAVVSPRRASHLAITEYYIVLYPLACLLMAGWQQPAAILLLVAHCVLFPSQGLGLVRETVAMLRIGRSGTTPKTAATHP